MVTIGKCILIFFVAGALTMAFKMCTRREMDKPHVIADPNSAIE